MNTLRQCMILGAGFAALAAAQDSSQPQRVTAQFRDPAAPHKLEVTLMNGTANVTVRGVERNDVEVNYTGRGSGSRGFSQPPPGMHRIGGSGTIEVIQDNNTVRVGAGSIFGGGGDIDIQVPVQTAVTVAMSVGGKVVVDNIAGEVEVNHLNGNITVTNASGPVVAHSSNGKIVASLSKLAAGKSMSFSTFNGEIDVTLPADAKATLKARTDNGEIDTDFDVKLEPQAQQLAARAVAIPAPPVPPAPPAPPLTPAGDQSSSVTRDQIRQQARAAMEQARDAMRAASKAAARARDGRVLGDGYVEGTINGGGTEIQFTTFNGRILIHKK
jgi:hypothetical protein